MEISDVSESLVKSRLYSTREYVLRAHLDKNEEEIVKNTFQEIIELTKAHSWRNKFRELGLISILCEIFENIFHQSLDKAVAVLKVLRNLCVNNIPNQNEIRNQEKFIVALSSHFESLLKQKDLQIEVTFLRPSVQFLVNFITGNEENQSFIWNRFSSILSSLLFVQDGTLFGYVCVTFHNITANSKERRKELFNNSEMIKKLIQRSDEESAKEAFEWIYFIVKKSITDDLFSSLYEICSNSNYQGISKEQVNLLRMIDALLVEKDENVKPILSNLLSLNNCRLISSEFHRLYNTNMNIIFSGKLEEREIIMEVFVLLLETLANATAKIQYLPNSIEIQKGMKETGILSVVITLLSELLKRDQNTKEQSTASESASEYSMKGDLVRIIGNLSHNNKECQDEVRKLEGIHLILNCTKLDDKNPILREWAIFCLRNVCENNSENQAVIEKLRIIGVDNNPELADIGLKADISNGRVKFTKSDF